MAFDAQKTKKDFPIFAKEPHLTYLDTAASSQTPVSVLETMSTYYTENRSNISRGVYGLSEKATESYENARGTVKNFLGAKKHEVIFTPSSTYAMNMLVDSLEELFDWEEDDEVVLSIMEHHSIIMPLQRLAKEKKCVLKYVPLKDDNSLDIENALELITDKTKIVATMLVSNVTGQINDMSQIIEKAKKKGAVSVVDAAQAVGHIPVDVDDLDADFLFFSGHKMCGPTGVGVLCGRRELLEKMEPSILGGGMVSEITKYKASFLELPQKFEAGTPPIAEVIGLAGAIDYLEAHDIENIHNHVMSLHTYALEALGDIKGIDLYTTTDSSKNAGVVSFSMQGIHPHDVGEILSRNNIATRTGHHCALVFLNELGLSSTTRISFYLYNTTEDIDACVEALKQSQKLFL